MVLAMTEIYSVISYSASQRKHEFAVRLAVGAQRVDLLGMVLKEGMTTALVGVVFGSAAAVIATRALKSFLFGISPYDPIAFLTNVVLMLVICASGCLLPAVRASQTEPLSALKAE